MNYVPKMNRRTFRERSRRGRRAGARFRPSVRRTAGDPRRRRHAGDQCLGGDPPGRHRRCPRGPLRDGQGTLTGLAQLVAEELECDWAKVTWEYPTPGQSVARKRVWGDFSTGGSRGIRMSHEYVRKGGAAAREMLKQAAANEWKVPVSEVSAANGVITHTASGRTTTYGKVAEAAAKLEPPKDIRSRTRRTGRSRASRSSARHPGQDHRQAGLRRRPQAPGMLNAIKESPVMGGKVKSFDAAKVAKMPGVKKVVQVGDTGVAVVADTWWQAKTALDALPIVWDEGENAKVSSASIAEWLKAGLDAPEAFVGN